MNENLDRENHLPQQIFPPLPLINVALPPNPPPEDSSVPPNDIDGGEGGRKSISAILSVFPYREMEKYARILRLSQPVLSKIVGLKSRTLHTNSFSQTSIARMNEGLSLVLVTFRAPAALVSLWRRANARNVSF